MRLFVLCVVWVLAGCSSYFYPNALQQTPKAVPESLASVKYIFLSPYDEATLHKVVTIPQEAFLKEGNFLVLRILPDQATPQNREILAETAILSYQVIEEKYFEAPISNQELTGVQASLAKKEGIYSNAIVKIHYVLSHAQTKEVLLDKVEETSFQQFYHSPFLEGRPDADFELDRLKRLNFARVARDLNPKAGPQRLNLEEGIATSFLHRAFSFFGGGNALMGKGIRFTDAALWNSALITFLKVSYEPLDGESDRIFLQNRASALYNMGQIYMHLKDWKNAAVLFSLANQTVRSLHYAQSWADAVRNEEANQKVPYLQYDQLLYFTPEKLLPPPQYKLPSDIMLQKDVLYPPR